MYFWTVACGSPPTLSDVANGLRCLFTREMIAISKWTSGVEEGSSIAGRLFVAIFMQVIKRASRRHLEVQEVQKVQEVH